MTEPGEAEAFDAFYRAQWARLAGALRLTSGDAMTADEIAQETFTRAWMRWAHVSELDRPEGWVYVTAFRLMRRRLKREAARPSPATERSEEPLDLADRIAVQRALAALPIRQRQAVVARLVLGFDGPAAAEMLGVRPDNLRQILSRALKDLRISPELVEQP